MILNNVKKSFSLQNLGEKPYLCDLCGSKFRCRSGYRRHRKNIHFKGQKGEFPLNANKKNRDQVPDQSINCYFTKTKR